MDLLMKRNCMRFTSLFLTLALVFSVSAIGAVSIPTAAAPALEAMSSTAPAVATAATVDEAVKLLTQGDAPAAKSVPKDGVLTDCGGDCGHAPSIIIPGIGQSDVYLLDEDGNRAKDEDGNDINAFPVIIDIDYLIKTLALPLAKMLITQKDNGFTDFAAEAIGTSLAQSAVDLTGQPVANLELRRFPQSVAAGSEDDRRVIYNTIPLQDYTKVAGEDHLYFFAFNSFGNNLDIAEELYNFIQQVKAETGHDKVNIVPISLGSTVANTLFEVYPQVKNDLEKVVYIVPALDGSRLVGDLYKGTLRTDDEALYKTLLPSLMEDDYTAYLINVALRLIPKQIILDLVDKIIDKLRDIFLLNCTMIWGLVPSGDYDALAAEYLSDPAHAEIKRQTDIFHRAQTNAKANILSFIDSGVKIYDIVDYNFPLYSFIPSYETHNGDGLIHLESSSLGATSGYIDTPLPAGYVQQDTYCTHPGQHNHISPDGIVDASTGVLAETTFYFANQDHEGTGRNDVIMKLATEILLYDNLVNVHSMPERFPQFNVGRETKGMRNDLLPTAKRVDQSTLSAQDAAELQAAIDQCEAMLATTVVVYSEFTDAETRLNNILIKIGVRQAPEEDKVEKYAKPICKLLSDAFYIFWGPRGFSDPRV
jgi:hypothetical protein